MVPPARHPGEKYLGTLRGVKDATTASSPLSIAVVTVIDWNRGVNGNEIDPRPLVTQQRLPIIYVAPSLNSDYGNDNDFLELIYGVVP